MGQVSVAVGGRTYALSCSDGEEAHLAALGEHLAAQADALTAAIGTMSEPRLLLMAGLQIADDLFAARAAGTGSGAAGPASVGADAAAGGKDATAGGVAAEATGDGADDRTDRDLQLAAILARVEALAALLEK